MSRSLAVALAVASFATAAALALVQSEDEVARLVEVLDVDPGEVVADVGAGDGRFSVALARVVGDEGRVYATEVDPRDLETIRDRVGEESASNVTVVEGSQEGTGLPEACCDAILLRRVYHHFTDPDAMRAALKEALQDDGLLLLVEFEARSGHGIDRDRVVSDMEGAGFELVETFEWTGDDYALLFREPR